MDWQLRNGYAQPMAVVWRVQFFNDTSGKNEMSGWMLEHLKAGEALDGWNVEGGHSLRSGALSDPCLMISKSRRTWSCCRSTWRSQFRRMELWRHRVLMSLAIGERWLIRFV